MYKYLSTTLADNYASAILIYCRSLLDNQTRTKLTKFKFLSACEQLTADSVMGSARKLVWCGRRPVYKGIHVFLDSPIKLEGVKIKAQDNLQIKI